MKKAPPINPNGVISAETLCCKLAAWRNFKTPKFAEQARAFPRLPELLWFIQWQSMQPGGLPRFADEFLSAMPSRVGTPSMHRFGKTDAPYNGEERKIISYEIPQYFSASTDRQASKTADEFWDETRESERDHSSSRPQLARRAKFNHAEFYQLCRSAALEHLAQHLHAFCTRGCDLEAIAERERQEDETWREPHSWADQDQPLNTVWYLNDLPGALIEYMDLHAARARQSLAMTAVAVKVFDALQYAWEEKAMVKIEGDTRFGKTQSVRTWSDMFPGRARLVRTPCSSSEFDLFEAVAESVGIEVTLKTTHRELKSKVEFVIRHGGLMFVFDEAHFLLPVRFSKLTSPMRLNWIRTRMADHGCPLALVTTPQDFKDNANRFTRATGHNINQFLGRTILNIRLPQELDRADLIAVAKIHFPDLDVDYLDLIAAKAMQSESYLMAVESIARRAHFIARREARAALSLADVETAIEEVLPASIAPSRPRTEAPRHEDRKQPIAVKRAARSALVAVPAMEAPQRETTPALQTAS